MRGLVLRILFVCTGNLCRSPMAELLSRSFLDSHLTAAEAAQVSVSSAGTRAWSGSPIEPRAAQQLSLRGVPAQACADFVARQLTPELVGEADLVLAAAREHRAAAVLLVPAAAARTYTLRQLARLTAGRTSPPGDVAARGLALVAAAAAQRGLVSPARPADDDIRDPFGASKRVFARCLSDIEASLAGPLNWLAGRHAPPADPAGPAPPASPLPAGPDRPPGS